MTWDEQRDGEPYRTGSLATQGLVHCSDPDQVVDVAAYDFPGRDDLLLCVDPDRLDAEVRHEALGEADEPYPHVYGPIERDAIVDGVPFPSGEDGFRVPGRAWEPADW